MKTSLPLLCALALLTTPAFADEAKKPAPAAPAAPAPAAEEVKVVTPDEVEKLAADKGQHVTVLDVRTPEEYEMGHIAGAVNVSYLDPEFARRIAAMDKTRTYIVHCAAGNRSARAVPQLQGAKFSSLLHMSGGYKAWVDAGKPVETAKDKPQPK